MSDRTTDMLRELLRELEDVLAKGQRMRAEVETALKTVHQRNDNDYPAPVIERRKKPRPK